MIKNKFANLNILASNIRIALIKMAHSALGRDVGGEGKMDQVRGGPRGRSWQVGQTSRLFSFLQISTQREVVSSISFRSLLNAR